LLNIKMASSHKYFFNGMRFYLILVLTLLYMSCGVSSRRPFMIKTSFGKSAGFSKCGL